MDFSLEYCFSIYGELYVLLKCF